MPPRTRRQKAVAPIAGHEGGAAEAASAAEPSEAASGPSSAAPNSAAEFGLPTEMLLEVARFLKPRSRTLANFAMTSRETYKLLVPLLLSTVVLEQVLAWKRHLRPDPKQALDQFRSFLNDALDLGKFNRVRRINFGGVLGTDALVANVSFREAVAELCAKCKNAEAVATTSLPDFLIPLLDSMPALKELEATAMYGSSWPETTLQEIRKRSWPLRRLVTENAELAMAFSAKEPGPEAVMRVTVLHRPGDPRARPTMIEVLNMPKLRFLGLELHGFEELPAIDRDFPDLLELQVFANEFLDVDLVNLLVSRAPNLASIRLNLEDCDPENIAELSADAIRKIRVFEDGDFLHHLEVLLEHPSFNPREIANWTYEHFRHMNADLSEVIIGNFHRRITRIWPKLCRLDRLDRLEIEELPTRVLLGGLPPNLKEFEVSRAWPCLRHDELVKVKEILSQSAVRHQMGHFVTDRRPPKDISPQIRSRAIREEIDFWRAGKEGVNESEPE
ncbi:hypothetical protein DFJ74DRAFT_207162 [Hyaloraphidium curvatum]|nr:hypothetical protein DFJ74DRAFT_207162 [Hyaloraphidium curvatum]